MVPEGDNHGIAKYEGDVILAYYIKISILYYEGHSVIGYACET